MTENRYDTATKQMMIEVPNGMDKSDVYELLTEALRGKTDSAVARTFDRDYRSK